MKIGYLHILKWFFPLLFISYTGFISLFTHSHVVNGVTIVHSHPYTDDGQHSHTAGQFQLIDLLSTIHATDSAVSLLTITAFLILICHLYNFYKKSTFPPLLKGCISLRAPPCLV